jgi:peptidoglycan/xylan/chitin deacetylase (PgdA/CDA1 family)
MDTRNSDTTIKIPVLMYHEVSREIAASKLHTMTPMYNVSESLFESQIEALSKNGYRSIFFEDVGALDPDGKYVVITFDDGLIGNVKFALPVLRKYGFKAVFFAAAGSIGSPGFMSWTDLQELIDSGMSIQSHTMSHRSLQILSDNEVAYELRESKRLIEDKLKVRVSSISFPHGSYNQKVVRIASDSGYEFMCSSESVRNFNTTFSNRPVVLGRITVTGKLGADRLLKLAEYDNIELLQEKLTKGAKNLFKLIIGINNYRKLYRFFFNIKTS